MPTSAWFLLVLALLCVPVSARAQDPSVRLEYVRGAGTQACPDEEGLRAAVAVHTGRDLFIAAGTWVLSVRIERQGSTYVATEELRDDTASARPWVHPPLSSSDCRGLVRVVGLSVAMKIDASTDVLKSALVSAVLAAEQPHAVEQHGATEAGAAVPLDAPVPPLVLSEPRSFDFYAGLDLLLGVGSTPGPALGAGYWIQVRPASYPTLSFEVTGRMSWTANAPHEAHIALNSIFSSGLFAMCGHVRFVFLCPVVGVGALYLHEAPSVLTDATLITTTPVFVIYGGRLGIEHHFEHGFVRGFLELVAMPGTSKFALYGSEWWRPWAGGVVGIGAALKP